MTPRTHILCFGNSLAGDDGFGPAVYAALSGSGLPAGVTARELPVRGWDALDCFADCEQAILVDAIRGHGTRAGTLAWHEPRTLADDARRGEHALGLAGILRLLPSRLARPPAIRILGVEPLSVVPCQTSLSPVVAGAIPRAVALIRGCLP